MSSLIDRLEAARRQRFVGRTTERELFRDALTADEPPFFILFMFGPGGVGKTSLLREFVYLARQAGSRVIQLDARLLDPTPELFLDAVRRAAEIPAASDLFASLAQESRRILLTIDTYELLNPLDGWLRETFLPQLPLNTIAVTAGRNPPDLAWRTDPGWQEMMRLLPLRNLSQEEGRALLVRRQIPAASHTAILEFTHGHPLALSLVADLFAQQPDTTFSADAAPDIIKTLVDQLVQQVPSPNHREALEACALVRLTTESLLSALLETAEVHELFEWLRSLSFVDAERRGLYPHDLAREALAADLRWRHPDWHAELHARARSYYMAHIEHGSPQEQRRTLNDYIFLHRDNPMVRPYFEWQASGQVFTDRLRPEDEPALLAMVRQHEGETSAQLAAYWLARQPEQVAVFRPASGEPQGLLMMLSLEKIDAPDRERDPAIAAASNHLARQAPLRLGETATYFRFWLDRADYQGVSPVQTRIFLNMVQHYLTTPGLAYTFIPCADPAFWLPAFTYGNLAQLPEAGFTVDGRPYGVYGHDWRATPPVAWLELMAERELSTEAIPPPRTVEPVLVLSESGFATAVRDALRQYHDDSGLAANPLLRSRLVLEAAGADADAANRVATLRALLLATAEAFQGNPRQVRLYRALYHTYFQPAPTQEQAAELLDLPFSTYRRHLRQGLAELTQRLWEQELGTLGG